MYKKANQFFILVTCFLMTGVTFAEHVSWNHPDRDQSFALQQELRIFYRIIPDLKLLFEAQMKKSLSTSSTNNHPSENQLFPEILAFRFGGIYRLHPNFKIGTYYQLYNRRNHHTGNLNAEHIPILDLIPRIKLAQNLVAELRMRNEFNIYSGTDQARKNTLWYSIKLRPKLTYFLIEEAQFKLAAFLAYEIYIPVNYKTTHMENWIYTGVIFPITEVISLIPYYALIFHQSAVDHTGGMTHMLGLGINLNF